MSKVLILVEGQTEETFIRDTLAPHLSLKGVYCIPTLATTKRVKSGPDFKGGIVSYEKARNDIKRLLQDTSADLVTTMIDYYGFSITVPFRESIQGNSCFERVKSLEVLFKEDIGHPGFFPYLQLHEFEALVFVSPQEVAGSLMDFSKETKLTQIKNKFNSPEEIDDKPETIPSRRISEIFPTYRKTLHGPLIVKRIGFEKIRNECRHFDQWITRLEQL
jgi:hypothetical protein